VYELAYLLADGLLPVGKPADVVVHPGAGVQHLVATEKWASTTRIRDVV
jgi:hypothetical protein